MSDDADIKFIPRQENYAKYEIRKYVEEAKRDSLGSRHANDWQAAANIAGALAFAIADVADAIRERSS